MSSGLQSDCDCCQKDNFIFVTFQLSFAVIFIVMFSFRFMAFPSADYIVIGADQRRWLARLTPEDEFVFKLRCSRPWTRLVMPWPRYLALSPCATCFLVAISLWRTTGQKCRLVLFHATVLGTTVLVHCPNTVVRLAQQTQLFPFLRFFPLPKAPEAVNKEIFFHLPFRRHVLAQLWLYLDPDGAL